MDLFQHFHPEERAFVEQVIEWQEMVINRYSPKLTDFLDPRQQDIILTIVGNHPEVKLFFSGGFENAERKRAILAPAYFQLEQSDFKLTVFEVNYPEKFVNIGHRDILGSLMNLGLIRDKFGDILIQNNQVQFCLAAEIASFVQLEMKKVGSASVTLEPVLPENLLKDEEAWDERDGTVSSLRVDTLLAEIFRQSRSKVIPHLKAGNVKVNWRTIEQPSYEMKIGDYLSFRGHGRAKLLNTLGKTKRDKWRIRYGIKK